MAALAYTEADLLSAQSLIEVPFIIVKIGNVTFGTYNKKLDKQFDGANYSVTYPNYLKSIDIYKVNGSVNVYTINLDYQVTENDDPNLIDKILGTIADTREITLSYGDWSNPISTYKDERAIITNVKTRVNMQSNLISYTINCVSTAELLLSSKYHFPTIKAKPSDVIKSLLESHLYGLTDIFTGMKDLQMVYGNNLIASNDKIVEIQSCSDITILGYILHLVDCMQNQNDTSTNNIQQSFYTFAINDEVSSIYGGPVFYIKEVSKNTEVDEYDTYSIDVGYLGKNFVTSFNVSNDEQWTILYKYGNKIDMPNYVYNINNDGELETIHSPSLLKQSYTNRITQSTSKWWTQVTEFPIQATITIKGLLRPSILCTKVRVNVYFFGNKHITSGLYIVIKQNDRIDENGYKTTLTLLRVGKDIYNENGIDHNIEHRYTGVQK